MQVRLAYHDSTIELCRRHYDAGPELPTDPPLGPVQSARDYAGCIWCDRALARDGEGGSRGRDL